MKSRGLRNNNPFNIRKSSRNRWIGKSRFNSDGTFEQFISLPYGLRAGILLLRNGYIRKGYNTIEQIVSRFAPESENNTYQYCNFLASYIGISIHQEIEYKTLNFYKLCAGICRFECPDSEISHYDIIKTIVNFKL